MYGIHSIHSLTWFCLVFTVDFGMSEVELKVLNVDPTYDAVLACSSNATKVFWMHFKEIVVKSDDAKEGDRYCLMQKFGNENNLKISTVKKHDAGIYSCYAEGNLICQYNLIVNYKAKITQSSNSSNDVEELYPVRLWCNATGIPAPKTTWYVLDENKKEYPLGFTGSYMEVRNVTRGCSSTFRCKSTNRLNKDSPAQKDMRVNAVYTPEVDISLDEPEKNVDKFTFDDIDIEYTVFYRVPASKKSTVILTCHVSAYPNASISWKVGEQIIGSYPSGKKNLSRGRITMNWT